MKKSFLLLVFACFWLAGVFAQTGAIENLQVAQRTDGSGLVDIHFDLNGTGASYILQFEASFDDGANYAPLSPEFLTGQLEQVLPGAGKHIIWAGKASHPETFSTQTRVRVIAIEYIPPTLPTVQTADVTNITSTSAISGGNVTDNGGAPVTARGVVWSTTPNPTLEENEGYTEDGEGIGEFTSEITGLQPETTYYVSAYAENSVGVSYGEELIFQTNAWECGNKIFDIDGNSYNTVMIGEQCWMKENLKTTKYSDGDLIDFPGIDDSAWENNSTGAFSWYNNDATWKDFYGALYNWHAVNNPSGLCPQGWKVPSDEQWTQLTTFIGGTNSPSGNKLKSCRQVNSPLHGECSTVVHPRWIFDGYNWGTDDYGFAALPGGYRHTTGYFDLLGEQGLWWSSSLNAQNKAWTRVIYVSTGHITKGDYNKQEGNSVRCIKPDPSAFNIPEVITSPIVNITSNSAISGGNVTDDRGFAVTARGVVWSKDPIPSLGENDGFTENGEGLGVFTSEITGSPNTTYHVRAYATNYNGTAYGDIVILKTTTVNHCSGMPIVIDIDDNVYNTVQIGNQCWMAENLNVGTRIHGNLEMSNNSIIEKYCYFNSDMNCHKYGGLYQWDELMQYSSNSNAQGICPEGWKLPSDNDWNELRNYVLSHPIYNCNINEPNGWISKALASNANWNPSSNDCAVGNNPATNNTTEFAALPAGYRDSDGYFVELNNYGRWWSITEGSEPSWVFDRGLYYATPAVLRKGTSKSFGISVRCLRDINSFTNKPPSSPSNPTPLSGATNQSINLQLTWECFDPEGDLLTYDVYFGVEQSPPIVASGITEQYYAPATVQYSTRYYWKIIAHDSNGNSSYGFLWSFITTNGGGQPCIDFPTITDVDGNVYNTVQIGDQCWMKENLKTTKYRNGNNISYPGSNNNSWYNNTTGAYAWYNNDINYKSIYGALYNWHAVNNTAGLCPAGWHVPSHDEWTALTTYLSSDPAFLCNSIPNNIGKALAAKTDWINASSYICCVGTELFANNATNFTALPGSGRGHLGTFGTLGETGNFWSSTDYNNNPYSRFLNSSSTGISIGNSFKMSGKSVRCLKD